jgi:GNAT superfamily N-acetyltransferase
MVKTVISRARSIPTSPISIHRAIEVFAHGFGFVRSYTHPYAPHRVGPLWVLRDDPRKNPRDYRREEWLAYCVDPVKVDQIARQHTRGRYAVCAFHTMDEPDQPLRDRFKALGYRLGTTEPMMIHRLARIPRADSPATIRRVTTQGLADRLAKAAGRTQILPQHLKDDSAIRQYVALIDEQAVGWVRSIIVGDATWCSHMEVLPKFRRRGIAKSMLSRMLRDDRDAGATVNVLLSSHTGAMLYPVVGYEQIATLLFFTPRKQR